MSSAPNLGTALVTGANRGLGLLVARGLAREGYRVLAGVRDPARCPGDLEPLALDLGDGASVRAAAEALRGARLQVLVNNAAILLPGDEGLLELEEAVLARTLEINLVGSWRVLQAFAPLMDRGGRIVNVSSGGGQLSAMGDWAPAYCISKAALNALTVQAALALKGRGITVNAVDPGWARTDMGGPGAPRSAEEGAASILKAVLEVPPGRTGGLYRDGQAIPW